MDQSLLEGFQDISLVKAASIDRFLDLIWSRTAKTPPPRHALNLVDLVSASRRPMSNPWPKVVEKTLAGAMEIYGGGSGKGLGAFMIGDTGLIERINLERPAVSVPDDRELNKSEMCHMLRSCWHLIGGLISAGYLQFPSNLEEVRKFNTGYILTSELVAEMKESGIRVRSRDLVPFLADQGVHPVQRLPGKGYLVWRRHEVGEILPQGCYRISNLPR